MVFSFSWKIFEAYSGNIVIKSIVSVEIYKQTFLLTKGIEIYV